MKKLDLENLYILGDAEIMVGKKFLNLVKAEYTHYKLFLLGCHGFKSINYYISESQNRASILARKLNNYLIGVKNLKFLGDYYNQSIEVLFDPENILGTEIEGDVGTAIIRQKNDREVIISEPHYLY